ncbi:MAG: HEAT repeat domain-containing protein [Fusicatenibacter sp.]
MFGSKQVTEDGLRKMVKRGKWDKLRKQYLYADKETQIMLARACSESKADGSVNLLTSLLDTEDEEIMAAAVRSLGEVGDDHVVARIRQLAGRTTPDQKELKSAISEALAKITSR